MIKKLILTSKDINKSAYFFNTVGALSNSFQTMILMLVITRLGNVLDASILSIAYAVGNLTMTIGKYGTRGYQVTDIDEEFSFFEYVVSRFFTNGAMLLVVLIYLFNSVVFGGYSGYKTICLFLVCVLKMMDSFEDVLHGRLQQLGRLDIAAKILFVRNMLFIALFIGLYMVLQNLLHVLIITALINLLVLLYLNLLPYSIYKFERKSNIGNVVKMFKNIFPLALGLTLVMYLGNAPKYTIDGIFTDAQQTNFNVIYMPVFIISLMSSFIFSPLMGTMAELWAEKKLPKLKRIIFRQVFFIIAVTLVVMVGGYVIGLDLLEIVYGLDLSGEMLNLMLMLFSGGLSALMTFNIVMFTIWRKQKDVLIILSAFCVFYLVFATKVLGLFETPGLILFFSLTLFLVNVFMWIIGYKIMRSSE